jgi:transmembrane sensor
MAGGVAAALAAAACLAVVIGLQHPLTSRPMADVAAATAARVIEPERQILPDGSIVDLRHGAKIALAFSDESRVVILEKGEAHFSVTKNPHRPFIVETGTVKVSAVGTAFAVELGKTEVEVLVTEGRVSVEDTALASLDRAGLQQDDITGISATAPTPLVEAGQRAVVLLSAAGSMPRIAAVPAVEMTEHLSWRLPRLEFSETSITEAMAMFNRYNQRKLRSTDLAVGMMRITGVFRSDNVEGFVRALESSGLGLRSEHREREILIRLAK